MYRRVELLLVVQEMRREHVLLRRLEVAIPTLELLAAVTLQVKIQVAFGVGVVVALRTLEDAHPRVIEHVDFVAPLLIRGIVTLIALELLEVGVDEEVRLEAILPIGGVVALGAFEDFDPLLGARMREQVLLQAPLVPGGEVARRALEVFDVGVGHAVELQLAPLLARELAVAALETPGGVRLEEVFLRRHVLRLGEVELLDVQIGEQVVVDVSGGGGGRGAALLVGPLVGLQRLLAVRHELAHRTAELLLRVGEKVDLEHVLQVGGEVANVALELLLVLGVNQGVNLELGLEARVEVALGAAIRLNVRVTEQVGAHSVLLMRHVAALGTRELPEVGVDEQMLLQIEFVVGGVIALEAFELGVAGEVRLQLVLSIRGVVALGTRKLLHAIVRVGQNVEL